jgi:nucleoside transporter
MNIAMVTRLFVMMFLQYAVWNAWFSVLSASLGNLGFSGLQIGGIYSLIPLACIISPFIGGQIADRYVNTEKFLGVAHLIGGVLMLLMATQQTFGPLYVTMLVYSLLYAPTLPLTNSITFLHLSNVERQFGFIRVGGTIGWIAAGLGINIWRHALGVYQGDCFQLAGVLSLVLGVFCFLLPKTPPKREGAKPWAFLEAIRLMRDKVFLMFILISFIVATQLQFYYVLTAPFLISIGIGEADVGGVMTIGQVTEILAMLVFLPWMLPKYGVRKCLMVGIVAWLLRYGVFSVGQPTWFVVASLTLHGFCYVFFFIIGQIYVNSVASEDIRGSAQGLHTFVTMGLGLFLGSYLCGWVQDLFRDPATNAVNYTNVFLVPCVLIVLCIVVFLLTFHEPEKKA